MFIASFVFIFDLICHFTFFFYTNCFISIPISKRLSGFVFKLIDGFKTWSLLSTQSYGVTSWFSTKQPLILARIPQKDLHGGHTTYRVKSHKRTICLRPTTQPNPTLLFSCVLLSLASVSWEQVALHLISEHF